MELSLPDVVVVELTDVVFLEGTEICLQPAVHVLTAQVRPTSVNWLFFIYKPTTVQLQVLLL